MTRLLCVAAALVVSAVCGVSETQAQGLGFGCNGFGFNNYGYNFNRSGFERPPYFALFPPVYYSDQIVRRPMGVSPFAAPPGVMPVEMHADQNREPQVIRNPYFRREAVPVKSADPDTET